MCRSAQSKPGSIQGNQTMKFIMSYFFYSLLLLILSCHPAFAQYNGGWGNGLSNSLASSVLLNTNSPFAGGTADGTAQILTILQSLTTNTVFSGGPADGTSATMATGNLLSAGSMYAGGSNDGIAKEEINSLPLTTSGMYAGGIDDGFDNTETTGIGLNSTGQYAGGVNDGSTVLQSNLVSLIAAGKYAGGSNDGLTVRISPAVSLNATTVYAGGVNDGFSSVLLNAAVPLPVRWEMFTVSRNGKDALLQWSVGNIQSTARFEIERSYDGISFEGIGSRKGFDGANTSMHYQYTDPEPAIHCAAGCEKVYYRLREINFNENFTYSPIRWLPLDTKVIAASVYPNPASDKIIIQLHGITAIKEDCTISLFNSVGIAVISKRIAGSPFTEIDVRHLPTGVYYLSLNISGTVHPFQIIISH